MKREEPANQALNEFQAYHKDGAFLCRYTECPRSSQGFASEALREDHEYSHKPKFKCSDSSCGFSGRIFRNRAALRKHVREYHEENTSSIPDSLAKAQAESTSPLPSMEPFAKLPFGTISETLYSRYSHDTLKLGHISNSQKKEVENDFTNLSSQDIPPDLKQAQGPWQAMYNPAVERQITLNNVAGTHENSAVNCICFSPDERFIALGVDSEVKLVDFCSREPTRTIRIRGPKEAGIKDIQKLLFSPCGKFFAFYLVDACFFVSSVHRAKSLSE